MGLDRIARAFAAARAGKRAALMPYYTLGYPDLATSERVIAAIAAAGADLIELGIPFSDPLADGPTIQRSTQVALAQGVTLRRCLELTARLRTSGVAQPLLLMGYVNPILAYGVERFIADAHAAGADGFIVPDLPPEEAANGCTPWGAAAGVCAGLHRRCRAADLALVHLLAPASPAERLALVSAHTAGFLYLVSVTGVTGAREALSPDLAEFVGRVRRVVRTPVAVGFGISTPAQARAVGQIADGVIVGSALIQAAGAAADAPAAAADFVWELRAALSPRR